MFGREVYVTLDKDITEVDGNEYEYIKSFGISVSEFNKTWELEGFDASETVYLIRAISDARKLKKKYLRINLPECGFTRFIDIPRWAYTDLIEQIWRYIGYKHGNSKD